MASGSISVNPLHQRFLKHRRYSSHHARDACTSAPPQVTFRVAIPQSATRPVAFRHRPAPRLTPNCESRESSKRKEIMNTFSVLRSVRTLEEILSRVRR